MGGSTTANRQSMVALAVALSVSVVYSAWVISTYLLEGRIETLLRPEATLARFFCALIANPLIGVAGAIRVLRLLARS